MKILILYLWLISIPAFCQLPDIEEWVGNLDQAEKNTLYVEYLYECLEHPLDVNSATKQQLEILPCISPAAAARIIWYRSRHGRIKNLSELANIPGIKNNYQMIRPFLTVRHHPSLEVSCSGRHRMQRRIPLAKGYQEDTYCGNPYKVYTRIKGNYKNYISIGLLTQ